MQGIRRAAGATTLVVLALAAAPTTALAAGAMRLSPDPVDYHRVKVGTTYTKKITVKNVGDTTLSIAAYRVWDSTHGWAIGATCPPLLLAPGDRCRFELELTPRVAGDIAVGVDVVSYNYETQTSDVTSPQVTVLARAVN